MFRKILNWILSRDFGWDYSPRSQILSPADLNELETEAFLVLVQEEFWARHERRALNEYDQAVLFEH